MKKADSRNKEVCVCVTEMGDSKGYWNTVQKVNESRDVKIGAAAR